MTLTERGALPSVSFEAAPAPLDDSLPRMDVTGFVGIAASGPMHLPVAVEDVERFRDVFGADPVLARVPSDGTSHRAYLGSAVEAFFRNGGQRAWIVRGGDEAAAAANRFTLPGVVVPPETDGAGWRLAALDARSPGSWSDDVRAGAVLRVAASTAVELGSSSVTLDLSVDVAAGDLVRLDFGEGLEALVVVDSVTTGADGLRATWERAWWVDARPDLTAMPLSGAQRLTTGTADDVDILDVLPAADEGSPPESPPEPGAAGTVTVADGAGVAPGDLLRVPGGSGGDHLLAVGDETDPEPGSPPLGGVTFRLAGAWLVTAEPPGWFATASLEFPPVVEVLRLDVLAWRGEQLDARLAGLGLAAGHPRFLGDLPTDDVLFARTAGLPRYPAGAAEARVADFAHAPLPALWRAADEPRFPFAGGTAPPAVYLPLQVGFVPDPLAAGPLPGADPNTRLPRDGVAEFGAELFADLGLTRYGIDTLREAAFHVAYVAATPRRLRGIHALLPVDEVTLLAVPDAVHPGWRQQIAPPPVVLTAPLLAEPAFEAAGCVLSWTAVDDAFGYELEQALDAEFTTGAACTSTTATAVTKDDFPYCPATYSFRVRATRDLDRGPWSNVVQAYLPTATFMPCRPDAAPPPAPEAAGGAEPAAPPAPRLEYVLDDPAADESPAELAARHADLEALHTALLRMCAARGDIVALLALPARFRADEALDHVTRLRSGIPELSGGSAGSGELAPGTGILPLGSGEGGALSYAAVYHPWVVTGIPGVAEGLRPQPPVGAMAGVYAARALERGAWIAPANQPLAEALGLEPELEAADRVRLAARAVNTFGRDPRGFAVAGQDTLSAVAALRPVNVRRLMILLRRLALREGDTYVFRPNDAEFRRLVRMRFETLLAGMFRRGAFAGATAPEAYRVDVSEAVNPPASVELGRLIVDIQVAPSRPMKFIRVRLVMTGQDQVAVAEVAT